MRNAAEGGAVKAPARRVIGGLTVQGHSTIAVDEVTRTRAVRPNGAVVEEVWRQEEIPAAAGTVAVRRDEFVNAPPSAGASVKLYTVPPDTAMDMAAYEAFREELYGRGNASSTSSVPGIHRTDTLDVVTVVSGEVYAVFEDAETLLRVGDSLIIPGIFHAWSNRSTEPATIISTVFPLAH